MFFSKLFNKDKKGGTTPLQLHYQQPRSLSPQANLYLSYKKVDELDEHSHAFKVILIGDASAHKAALLTTYIGSESPFDSDIKAVGVNFQVKTLITPIGDTLSLQIWDTDSPHFLKTLSPYYFRCTHSVLLCYNPSVPSSFEYIKSVVREYPYRFTDQNYIIRILEITTQESDRHAVPLEEAQTLAYELGAEVSRCCLGVAGSVGVMFNDLAVDLGRMHKLDFGVDEYYTGPPQQSV